MNNVNDMAAHDVKAMIAFRPVIDVDSFNADGTPASGGIVIDYTHHTNEASVLSSNDLLARKQRGASYPVVRMQIYDNAMDLWNQLVNEPFLNGNFDNLFNRKFR